MQDKHAQIAMLEEAGEAPAAAKTVAGPVFMVGAGEAAFAVRAVKMSKNSQCRFLLGFDSIQIYRNTSRVNLN
jgi:hypothetical protein